jgi:hypothetical protein
VVDVQAKDRAVGLTIDFRGTDKAPWNLANQQFSHPFETIPCKKLNDQKDGLVEVHRPEYLASGM